MTCQICGRTIGVMLKKYLYSTTLILAAFILPFMQLLLMPRVQAVSPHVVISEVVPEASSANREFIELYNNSAEDVPLGGWKVQLRSANNTVTRSLDLKDTLRAHGYALLASTDHTSVCEIADFPCFSAAMAATGGHVVVLNEAEQVVDKLGWGTAINPEGTAMIGPPFAVTSIFRKTTSDPLVLQDTDDNFNDFTSGMHTPTGGDLYETPQPVDACPNLEGVQEVIPDGYVLIEGTCQQLQDPDPEPEPEPTPNCQGISISEILPNPAGSDTGQEYIEIFNETSEPVDLTGCILKVGNAQQVLSGAIDPGYKVFYGLNLPNAAGGEVLFITNTTSSSVVYPADMKDNEAYGLIDGLWHRGLAPSPGAMSVLPVQETEEPTTSLPSLKPCAPGKYRNPATNRCKNIETASSTLKPCQPDQIRNPETNRCRKISSTASTLKPCAPDQVRNPATNRCKKAGSEESKLKPCKEGQERNPETNRCRKVASVSSTNAMNDPKNAGSRPVSYYVLGIVALLALAYGIYEYRQTIWSFITRRKEKVA